MVKTVSAILSILLLSACATVNEETDSQMAETQVPTLEMQPVESNASLSAESVKNELAVAGKKKLSKQEIKSIQAQLKAAGFDPGPLDGTLGVKTLSALRRLQSGCANLKDLFENTTSEIFPELGQMQAVKQNAADKGSSTDEIRLIQVRLKDAGFDVGQLDGVMGSKTKSALLHFQSGCTMVKDLPMSLDNEPRIVERISGAIPTTEKQIPPMPPKVAPAPDAVKDEAGKMSTSADKSSNREEIHLLQTQLKAAGFDPGPLDGVLGPKTRYALQQYRSLYGASGSRNISSDTGVKFAY